MKILLLSQSEVLADFLRNNGQILLQTMDKIDENFVLKESIDFIVSYGYRYIVSGEILRHFPKRAVNLHISLLPYNKGADPNFWSFVEDTPKGVSIHYMDSGLDTGEIIAQKEVKFDIQNETFASSYNVLQATIQRLFMDVWSDIKSLRANSHAQNGGGPTINQPKKKSICTF
ncbi:formyltransferase family protein [Campylobacter curvus]|uniref:formyltransferase family protein n=1 Tax=Campylobacter curvus TaxID=200 RepID=UPI00146FF329|nr:formyltransferase family protein [Campylobacter curvus]